MSGELLREAYPLTWPDRQARTPATQRRHAPFTVSIHQSLRELRTDLDRLGAKDVVVSSNVPVRRDGFPLSDAREPADPGVAVYFDRRPSAAASPGRWVPFVIACDSFSKVKWNLRAVGKTIEAMRAIERNGSTAMLEQAFTGFAALPPASAGRPWWEVLGVDQGAGIEAASAAFRALAKRWHPDVPGGDARCMSELNRAWEEASRR